MESAGGARGFDLAFGTSPTTRVMRGLSLACLGLAAGSCEDEAVDGEEVLVVEDTMLRATNAADLEPGCGVPEPPTYGPMTYRLRSRGGTRVDVYNDEEGWTLRTTREGDVLRADGVEADVPEDAYLRYVGVTGRFFRRFELDTRSGALRSVVESPRLVPGPSGEAWVETTQCYVNAHVPPAQDQLRVFFDGRYYDDGEHAEAEPCGELGPLSDGGAGYLLLTFGPDPRSIEILEEGVGCSFSAHSTDGRVYEVAPGTACVADPDFGMTAIGVVSRVFDAYRLDLDAMELGYRARQTRIAADGSRRTACHEVVLVLEVER